MADHEMMLAERPGGGGGGGGAAGGGEGPSVGNYKGVMLCNRPFAGPTGALHSRPTTAGAWPPTRPRRLCAGLQDPSSGDSKPPLRFGVPDGRRELGVQPTVKVGEVSGCFALASVPPLRFLAPRRHRWPNLDSISLLAPRSRGGSRSGTRRSCVTASGSTTCKRSARGCLTR